MVWRVLADFYSISGFPVPRWIYVTDPPVSFALVLSQIYNTQLKKKHVSSQNAIVLLSLTFPLTLPNFEPSQHTKSTEKI